MDVITFFKEKQRMTKECTIECCKCPLSYENNEEGLACSILERYYPEKAVEIIENWSKKHPIKTRQSEFLKLYPKAALKDGVGSARTVKRIYKRLFGTLTGSLIERENRPRKERGFSI